MKELLKPRFWLFAIKYLLAAYRRNPYAVVRLSHNDGVKAEMTASFRMPQNISIGKNVYVNEGCCIWAGRTGTITIGDYTSLGPNVHIFSSNHGIAMNELIYDQQWTEKDVIIGEDCWLGANSVVLPGVTLGKGTVVAAGGVVTKDTPPYSIVAGCPAKVIASRK